jgi:transcriptional regulator with XRE-family HTH domain
MTSEPIPAISRRVKELREAKAISQQALANAAGLSTSVISQLEQGSKADPRLSTLQALAKALRVDVCELIGEETAAKPAGRSRK